MRWTTRGLAATVVVALGTAATACGGGSAQPDEPTDDGVAAEPEADEEPAIGAGAGGDWEKIVPGGDCECADGSEFAFWVRDADPTKVVFVLEGGGACFDAETCAFTGDGENDSYGWNMDHEAPMGGGMYDFDREGNPFAGHSFIYVPLCTGDAYLGDVTREYSPELTVEHKGFVDGSAALSYLADEYPDATDVVVVGKTAGSIPAPVYGGLASDLVPDAHVTVFAGQSGSIPDDSDLVARMLDTWGAFETMPDWEANEGLTADDWRPTQFWIQAGRHDPDITMARFDYAFDRNASRHIEAMGHDPATAVDLIDANEARIEAAGITQHSYTAPGDDHGLFEFDAFYDLEVNGVRLTDWLAELLAGADPADVHCEDCDPPS